MNIRLSLIALLVTVYASAQEPDFDGKIELHAPTRAGWVITFKASTAMHVSESGKSRSASVEELPTTPDADAHVLKSLSVEKSGDLYFELSRFSDGTISQKWSLGAIQFREIKGGTLLAMAAMNLLDPDFSDHSKEDFEELGWLKKDYFVGGITYLNQPCFLFQTTTAKRPPTRRDIAVQKFLADSDATAFQDKKGDTPGAVANSSATPVTVIISAISRLPLVYNDGKILRTYSYKTSGLEPLVPPEKFAREFAAWKKHAEEINRAPVAP